MHRISIGFYLCCLMVFTGCDDNNNNVIGGNNYNNNGNGIDRACNPGDVRSCNTGAFGVCEIGKRVCLDDGSAWGECEFLTYPGHVQEYCSDSIDNDCDGQINEGCDNPCEAGDQVPCYTSFEGVCSVGIRTCLPDRSGYGECVPNVLPGTLTEVCGDGIDQNCNGTPDDGCLGNVCTAGTTITCDTQLQGICGVGQRTCLPDQSGWGPCTVTIQPGDVPEVCGDGIDQNCNGTPDDGCTCVPGTFLTCESGFYGVCAEGERECLPSGDGWTPCYALILPFDLPETCGDGDDNDCDGAIDENCYLISNSIECQDATTPGNILVFLRGAVSLTLVSPGIPPGEVIQNMELGSDLWAGASICWDENISCSPVGFMGDGVTHVFETPRTRFTPRVRTDANTVRYLNLQLWNASGSCSIVPDGGGGLIIDAT